MRIVHVTSAVDQTAPGIKTVVDGTVASIAGVPGLAVTQVGIVPRGRRVDVDSGAGFDRVCLESWPPRAFSYAPGLRRAIMHLRPDVIHHHGLWQYSATVMRQASVTSAARVVSPHGMLSREARRHHSLRKSVAWTLYQRACLVDADALHATSEMECAAMRECGLRQPVAVVPPGVNVPEECPRRERSGMRIAVCISRLHPLKGIVDLVQAWSRVQPVGWRLVIAGPDEGGYRRTIAAALRDCRVGGAVSLREAAWGEERDRLLGSADLVVLPSHSENFGLVVAEALAQGVPVVTTTGTPWAILESEGCGWWVPVGSDGLAAALDDACGLGRDVLDGKGRRGWNLARNTFNWSIAASRLADLYQWLVGRARKPECVTL